MAELDSATPVTADQRTVNIIIDDAADAASGIIDEVQAVLKRAAEKVDAEFSKNEARMHRYPAMFRGLMSKYYHYFVPRCVAIGPCHHGAAHLEQAEEMKQAAAYFICEVSGHSADVIYARILSVAGDAARQSLRCWFTANDESIQRDIFLLENQVPWLVLDALMSFMPMHVDVGEFISVAASSFEAQRSVDSNRSRRFVLNGSYKPAHLLDLLHHYQSGSSNVPSQSRTFILPTGITSLPQSTSAIDLAETGIQLTNNRTAKFRDMGLRKGLFFCKLFLAPLVMDDLNACWLLNMVVFETSLATRYTVTSYMLLIAMLMKREEDLHELRVKRVLHGDFSNQRTLSFLQDLVDLNFITQEHAFLLADLEDYRRKRWMWISLHKFIYKNFKYIVTVVSIIGVLVGIFQALFSISMKQH